MAVDSPSFINLHLKLGGTVCSSCGKNGVEGYTNRDPNTSNHIEDCFKHLRDTMTGTQTLVTVI